MTEAEQDFVDVVSHLTNYIQNERVRSFNAGVDEERERCAQIAEGLLGWGEPRAPELAHHIAKVIRDQSKELDSWHL